MTALLAALALALDPSIEVPRLSVSGMDHLVSFQADFTSTIVSPGKLPQAQAYRILVDRPLRARIQALNGDGKPFKEVVITNQTELLADYGVYQSSVKDRDHSVGIRDAALLRFPTLDPVIFSFLEPGGWLQYARDSFGRTTGWSASFTGDSWRLAKSTPGGRAAIVYQCPRLIPSAIELSSGSTQWNWKIRLSPLPSSASFDILPGTRRVQTISIPPPPARMDAATQKVVARMWRFYDKPRPLAVEVKDLGSEPTLILTDGIRIRQKGRGVDWSWDGSDMRIAAGGRSFAGKAGRMAVSTAAGDSGLRLDPTFGPMVFGDNPFRRLLTSAKVQLKGEVPTPSGQACLVEVKNADVNMTLAILASDGRVLSISSLPGKGEAEMSSLRSFTYLDPSQASGRNLVAKGRNPLPLSEMPKTGRATAMRG